MLSEDSDVRPWNLSDFFYHNTMCARLPIWTQNAAANVHGGAKGAKTIDHLPKMTGETVLVLGGGPSLWANLELVKEFKGIKIACLHQVIPLLKAGIVPNYLICVDAHPMYAQFIDDPIVDEHAHEMAGIFNICTHPKVLERWKGDKYVFTAWMDVYDKPMSMTRTFDMLTGFSMMQTGANAGTCGWFVAYTQWAKRIALLGLDFAVTEEEWAKDEHRLNAFHRHCKNAWGKELVTRLDYQSMRDISLFWIDTMWKQDIQKPVCLQMKMDENGQAVPVPKEMRDDPCDTIQCGEYTILDGAPRYEKRDKEGTPMKNEKGEVITGGSLRCMTFREFLDKHAAGTLDEPKEVANGHAESDSAAGS